MILMQNNFKNGFMDLKVQNLFVVDGLDDIDPLDSLLKSYIEYEAADRKSRRKIQRGLMNFCRKMGFEMFDTTLGDSHVIFYLPVCKISKLKRNTGLSFDTYFYIGDEWVGIKDLKKSLADFILDNESFGDGLDPGEEEIVRNLKFSIS